MSDDTEALIKLLGGHLRDQSAERKEQGRLHLEALQAQTKEFTASLSSIQEDMRADRSQRAHAEQKRSDQEAKDRRESRIFAVVVVMLLAGLAGINAKADLFGAAIAVEGKLSPASHAVASEPEPAPAAAAGADTDAP